MTQNWTKEPWVVEKSTMTGWPYVSDGSKERVSICTMSSNTTPKNMALLYLPYPNGVG